jgi:hypothetical protein
MNKRLSLAISAALLQGAAMSASAYVPATQLDSTYNVYFGGATASNLTLRSTVIERMCDPSDPVNRPIDTFTLGSHVNPNQWAVACWVTSAQVPGIATSPARVIFHKTNQGGSGTGVNPVEQSIDLPFLVVSTTGGSPNCAVSGTAKTTPAPTSRPYTDHDCTGGQTELRTPDGGTSDIEPNKFFGINTPANSAPFQNLGNLKIYSVAHLVFGIAITKDLRDSLQRVLYPTASVCHPTNGAYAANAETDACMVNLNTNEIRSLLTGAVGSWDQVMVTPAGSSTPTALTTAVNAAGGTLPTDNLVQICRRVNGSGTQAQANAILVGWPCDPDSDGNIGIQLPATLSDDEVGPMVALNNGSGDVRKCLRSYNDGSNEMTNPVKPEGATNYKRWAVGIQSLENNANLADKYRFVKIDGYAPTLKNVHSGNYADWAAQSVQWRNNPATFEFPVFGGDIDKIFAFLKDTWITIAAITNENAAYLHSFGQSGWMLEPKSGSGAPDNVFNVARPINGYTRAPLGTPNTCQAPVKSQYLPSVTIGD